jgi:hypothetical protein
MLLVQDGHQAHTRAAEALEAELAEGMIWSPGDHRPENLAALIEGEAFAGSVQAIDPQLYVARLSAPNPKKLGDHDLFAVPMRPRDLSARNLPRLVARILGHQAGFEELTHLIAPTISVPSVTDRRAQSAGDLADASLAWREEAGEERPLLISLALERTLLADQDSVDGLLDEVTTLEADGFYLLFELPPEIDRESSAEIRRRALYIVSALAENDFEVWVGYAGLGGYAMRAAGASAVASGWFQKQQHWSPGHWEGEGMGRQPKMRAYLASTIGSLLLAAELDPLRRADRDLYVEVLASPGDLAAELREGRSPADTDFSRAECCQQMFATLAALESRVSGDLAIDLARAHGDLGDAIELVDRVEEVVALHPRSGTRSIGAWQDALGGLASDLGIEL